MRHIVDENRGSAVVRFHFYDGMGVVRILLIDLNGSKRSGCSYVWHAVEQRADKLDFDFVFAFSESPWENERMSGSELDAGGGKRRAVIQGNA